jgi:hypothetical protein
MLAQLTDLFLASCSARRVASISVARPAESFAAEDEGETKHLQAMGGADARLRLFQMDLVDPASVQPAIEGAHGVFHLASPMILQAEDPEAILSIFLHDRSPDRCIIRLLE